MFLLYRYIFNSIYDFYNKRASAAGAATISIIALLQMTTVYLFYILPQRLNGKHWTITNFDKLIVVGVLLIVMLINYFYFYKIHSPALIDREMKSLSKKLTNNLQLFAWLHFILTIALFTFTANLP